MVHKLSNALIALYDIADEVPVAECVNELFLAMQKLLPFDGAAMGGGNGPRPYGLIPSGAHTFGLDPALGPAFARLAASDPVAEAFHAGGMRTMAVECAPAYSGPPALAHRDLAASHGIRHLLLSGTAQGPRPSSWMVLVRHGDNPFNESECAYATAAWPHLARCLHSVQHRLLDELVQAHGSGVALLYPDGAVAAADQHFFRLCRSEWNNTACAMLPASASAAMKEHGEFTGRTLRLQLSCQDGFMRCSATERTACELLTRAERVVAFRYASGESYKEIAIELHVSENTVRTHLAHVYDKLGIHRKTELINQIDHLH